MVAERKVVGIAGVGDMGSAIAETLLREDWSVVAYDLVPGRLDRAVAAGALAAGGLAELAANAEILAVVVDGQDQLEAVVDRLVPAAAPGTSVIVHTTVRPAIIVDLAASAAEHGVHVIDAAVGGGSEKARIGAMTLMIGGDEKAVESCGPYFEALGEHLFRLGPPGAGMAAKLVNNVLGISSYAMLLEAMQLAAAYGMDEDVVTSLVTQGWGDSRHARAWGRQDRRRRERVDADAQAYTRMSRDLRNAIGAANVRDVQMPLTEAAARLLPALLQARDNEPDRWLPGAAAPRCAVCGIELAAPYRSAGVHPECAGAVGGERARVADAGEDHANTDTHARSAE